MNRLNDSIGTLTKSYPCFNSYDYSLKGIFQASYLEKIKCFNQNVRLNVNPINGAAVGKKCFYAAYFNDKQKALDPVRHGVHKIKNSLQLASRYKGKQPYPVKKTFNESLFPAATHTFLSHAHSVSQPKDTNIHFLDQPDYSRPCQRVKRRMEPDYPQRFQERNYRLAVYLNKYASAGIALNIIYEHSLALELLNKIEDQPNIMPDLARLALYGSHVYGERRGEVLTHIQQKGLIGQTLCQLIFENDSIILRIAEIFDSNRQSTVRNFAELVKSWPYIDQHQRERELWQANYEAPEVPSIYLKDVYKEKEKTEWQEISHVETFDLDQLWVGSLTWTLLQLGARSVVMQEADKLNSTTIQSLIELGIGLVNMFNQEHMPIGAEPILYLGLLIYYMRSCPELSLEQIIKDDTLEPAFDLLKQELETRHVTAQLTYDGFADYQANYQLLTWRSRKAAAEELLYLTCGNAKPPGSNNNNQSEIVSLEYDHDVVARLMLTPDGQRCAVSNKPIPNLNVFYRQEVDKLAGKIRALDIVLLDTAFTPSDVLDKNFQKEELQFLQQSSIEWVIPRLSKNRNMQDWYFSNVPVSYFAKPDTYFFQADVKGAKRLYALQTTAQGYLLRKIPTSDPQLTALEPFMSDWPFPQALRQHRFMLLPTYSNYLSKHVNDTLQSFLERFVEANYQSYRLKIYEQGFEKAAPTFREIAETISEVIIPFYGCINAINAGRHQDVFIGCLMDGAMVGLPIIFVGIKSGLGLYRAAVIGSGRSMVGAHFSATNSQVFRNFVPATVQIAGGIMATRDQLRQFASTVAVGMLKSADPGFAALHSLGTLTRGVYFALLGKTAVGLISWQRNVAKLSGIIPKLVTAGGQLNFQIFYNDDGITPLTISLRGVDYFVFQVQNTSMLAVETGDLSPEGELLFSQLDLQSQFGILKKYFCLNIGSARCQLNAYSPSDLDRVSTAAQPKTEENKYFWQITSSSPIILDVVHPIHVLDYAEKKWVIFEINGRRWAFSQDDGALILADNLDDWRLDPHLHEGMMTVIEPGANDKTLNLHLKPPRQRFKRESTLHRLQDYVQFLEEYALSDEDVTGISLSIHNETTLIAQIGESRYLLSTEKNVPTFLLLHPTNSTAPAFRVAYMASRGDFIFASPIMPPNGHPIGELLRQKITEKVVVTEEPFIDIALPPLVNGAFNYGNKMFLKIGDRILHIKPLNEIYYTPSISTSHEEANGRYWALRYDLFTRSFDIIDTHISITMPLQVKNGALSRFEQLALRTYPKARYPTLSSLCQYDNNSLSIFPGQRHSVYTRLRQVALLLRLDAPLRAEIMHSSRVRLLTYKMDKSLPIEWVNGFQPLALWATAVKVATAKDPALKNKGLWLSRQKILLDNASINFRQPVVLVQGPQLKIYIINHETSMQRHPLLRVYELQLHQDKAALFPLSSEGFFIRWQPAVDVINQTVVTKFSLVESQQPVFWLDETNHIWAQTPDGVKTRLFHPNSHLTIEDIVVSPDGGTVILIVERKNALQRALYYHLPSMGSPEVRAEIDYYHEAIFLTPFLTGCAWWVTNQGELYIPWEDQWSYLEEDHPRWLAPTGYQPNFVSPDQRFLGYIKRDGLLNDVNIMLMDTIGNKTFVMQRSVPFKHVELGRCTLINVAFSALNAFVALAFNDGFIEIYCLVGEGSANGAVSLGYLWLPEARLQLANTYSRKPKQMILKFSNAFDHLSVFHDVGDFGIDQKFNGSYAISEIYLSD